MTTGYPVVEWDNRHGSSVSRAANGYRVSMSDLEHEMIVEQVQTQREAEHLRRLARRALVAAESAQEAAYGRHDSWIDDAMRATVTAP
jgi:hypothetical protein